MWITDAGIETVLVFLEQTALPHFAAFPLLARPEGREQLRRYYTSFAQIAHEKSLGFILETPTWRASSDWGKLLGYDDEKLAAANADAIRLMVEVRFRAQV
jgi:homocysteine S-methyltransferase